MGSLAQPLHPKLKSGIQGRRKLLERIRAIPAFQKGGTLWFHVASAGELEQALPIMDEIRKRYPDQPQLLTYFSPSAVGAVENERKRRQTPLPWDYADYSPLDFPSRVREFVDAVNPKAFISIHREVWPNLIAELDSRKVPLFLCAAQISAASRRQFRWVKPWYEKFKWIGTVDQSSSDFLSAKLKGFDPQCLKKIGDPRVNRVVSRRQNSESKDWERYFTHQTVLVCGSIWPRDFEALKPALLELDRRIPNFRVVLVPHEPSPKFVAALLRWMVENLGHRSHLWSQWKGEEGHLVVDGVGWLAELYRVATLAFVGGSFQKRVHNILEPLAYTIPTLTGPLIKNSAEALELQSRHGIAVCEDPQSLKSNLLKLISDEPFAQQLQQESIAFLVESEEAAERYADLICHEIDPSPQQ